MRNVCKIVSSDLRVTVGDGGDGYFGIPQNAEAADTDTINADTVLLSEAESVG